MSVHKKLMEARIKLQNAPLKKTGENKFAGYKYFELGDFLPTVQVIFSDLGLCGVVSYTQDMAKLTITNTEDGTSLEITSPMGSAALKGCHEVQNIGAVETYQRRYLWITAMEVIEHDVLDAVTGGKSGEPVKKEFSPVQPNSAGWDFWHNAEPDQKEYLQKCLGTIRDHMNDKHDHKAGAYFYRVMKNELEQAAVWSQFSKAEQKSIRQYKPTDETELKAA